MDVLSATAAPTRASLVCSSWPSLWPSLALRSWLFLSASSHQWRGMLLANVATSMLGSGGWPAAYISWVTTLPSSTLPMWHDRHLSA